MYKLFMVLAKKDEKNTLLEAVLGAKTYFKRQDAQKLYISPKKGHWDLLY
jgi:hypothetical protein